ncbi:MAG TPA: NAD(P)-dependent oxidoreductase [Erysipelothrix sp.]|nr:NAD(P)-dependent oxidoreductase [Erysipelothrix sp.]
MKIAWIGTGVMGAPMATHLADKDYDVKAFNRTHAKAKALEPKVSATTSIQDAVSDADIIFTIVGYPKDVKETFEEIFKHAQKGAIIVDMTTSSPTLAKDLYHKGNDCGFKVLDAPVTGGDLGAINATLSIMVGGDKDVFDKVYPLFEIMGKTINYMGEAGNGQHAKLANQASIAGNIAGTAESLAYAKLKGLDLTTMLDVIVGGSASSWQAANNGPKMIVDDKSPGFYVKHFVKDLNLILDEKEALKLDIVENIVKIYETLGDDYDDYGTQVIFDYYLNQLK